MFQEMLQLWHQQAARAQQPACVFAGGLRVAELHGGRFVLYAAGG